MAFAPPLMSFALSGLIVVAKDPIRKICSAPDMTTIASTIDTFFFRLRSYRNDIWMFSMVQGQFTVLLSIFLLAHWLNFLIRSWRCAEVSFLTAKDFHSLRSRALSAKKSFCQLVFLGLVVVLPSSDFSLPCPGFGIGTLAPEGNGG